MANYKQVSYGSQGSDVTELQKLLNNNGYNLSTDGIFGDKTQAAVKDYQKKNNLAVDGIVGNNTWGALTKVTTPAPTTTENTATQTTTPSTTKEWSYDPFKASDETTAAGNKLQELEGNKPGDFTYNPYNKSDTVLQAEALLQDHLANKPGDFTYDPYNKSDSVLQAEALLQDHLANKPGDFVYDAYNKSDDVLKAEALLQEHLANKPGEYVKSDAVLQAEALLQEHLGNKPGAYQSQWQTQLNDTLNKILNREKFSYDLNGDALYNQYKDQYMLQGQQAMMDTMGQAAAMTGGYGNSYAQSVGQQTYQGYLQQLNDRVPELYQLALDQYNREGDELYNQYGLYADREDQDYGRYRDTVSDFNTELDRLTNESRYQGEQDYGKYRDNVSDYYTETDRLTNDARYKAEDEYNKWSDKTNLDYGIHRDNVSDYYTEADRLTNDARYKAEDEYGKWSDKTNLDYGIHRDNVSDYFTELGLATDEYWNRYNRDYGQYSDDRSIAYDNYWNDLKQDYQKERDEVEDQQWQAQFDEAKRQYDEQYGSKNSSNSSNSTNSTDSPKKVSGYDNGSYSSDVVKKAQALVGADQDGKWGPDSTAKAKAKGYNSLAEAVAALENGGGPKLTDTDNTKLFRSSIMNSTEFARHGNKATVKGKTYTSYKAYIEAALADWTDNDVPHLGRNLTDDEVNFLMDYYGL